MTDRTLLETFSSFGFLRYLCVWLCVCVCICVYWRVSITFLPEFSVCGNVTFILTFFGSCSLQSHSCPLYCQIVWKHCSTSLAWLSGSFWHCWPLSPFWSPLWLLWSIFSGSLDFTDHSWLVFVEESLTLKCWLSSRLCLGMCSRCMSDSPYSFWAISNIPMGSATYVVCYSLSHVQLTPWSAARQAPLSMEFSMQEYW